MWLALTIVILLIAVPAAMKYVQRRRISERGWIDLEAYKAANGYTLEVIEAVSRAKGLRLRLKSVGARMFIHEQSVRAFSDAFNSMNEAKGATARSAAAGTMAAGLLTTVIDAVGKAAKPIEVAITHSDLTTPAGEIQACANKVHRALKGGFGHVHLVGLDAWLVARDQRWDAIVAELNSMTLFTEEMLVPEGVPLTMRERERAFRAMDRVRGDEPVTERDALDALGLLHVFFSPRLPPIEQTGEAT